MYFNFINHATSSRTIKTSQHSHKRTQSDTSEDEEGKLRMADRPPSMERFKFIRSVSAQNPFSRPRYDIECEEVASHNLKTESSQPRGSTRKCPQFKFISKPKPDNSKAPDLLTPTASCHRTNLNFSKKFKLVAEKGKDCVTKIEHSKLSNSIYINELKLKSGRHLPHVNESREADESSDALLTSKKRNLNPFGAKLITSRSKLSEHPGRESLLLRSGTLLNPPPISSLHHQVTITIRSKPSKLDTNIDVNRILSQVPEIKCFQERRVCQRKRRTNANEIMRASLIPHVNIMTASTSSSKPMTIRPSLTLPHPPKLFE